MNSFSKRHETLSNAAWFLAISASKFLISVLRRAEDLRGYHQLCFTAGYSCQAPGRVTEGKRREDEKQNGIWKTLLAIPLGLC